MPVGKEQHRVAVGLPETAQHLQGVLRQRHKTVAIASGITNLHPHPIRINIPDLQAQPQAIQSEEKYPVTQHPCGRKNLLRLRHGNNIRQRK